MTNMTPIISNSLLVLGDKSTVAVQTSVASITVPEGGTAGFQVRLTARPSGDVRITVARTSGDANLTVSTGGSFTIRRADYARWVTVTLAASEDGDTAGGQAVFTISGDRNVKAATVTATEKDNDAAAFGIMVDKASLTVPEGGTASFQVKLSANPGKAVGVAVGRASGDADLSVVSGGTLAFDASNWSTYKTVIISAREDSDTASGQAVFALTAAGAQAVNVTANEADKGVIASGRVVIDPVSRIEGHLRIEVEVAGGKVSKAWSSATLFRGIEPMLKGRSPLDAPLITQRLCGVCTYIHGVCSVRAIEKAANVTVTDNARIVRNLMLGAQFLHDHIVHFYHLHGMDWIDVVKALSADPYSTEALAGELSPNARSIDFAAIKAKLQDLVNTGNLGPFANAYWGHSAYKLSPEENLLLVAHYLEGLKQQVVAARMHAILGGKNPHPQNMVVGGVTCGGSLNATELSKFRSCLAETVDFVDTIYMPDLKLVAGRYPEWAAIGGFHNFLAYGEFPLTLSEPSGLFMPRGMILDGDVMGVRPVDVARITEHVARSWYSGATDRHPASGETVPAWTGMDVEQRYSWSKAPRYDGQPMEVGPLARVLVAYGAGKPEFVQAVHGFLNATGLTQDQLFSTLGRTAARGIETQVIGKAMGSWLNELQAKLNAGDSEVFKNYTLPASATGVALNEAPRGALGHWLAIDGAKKIGNYQMVVPSTWNFGPRCSAGLPSPLEKALVGTPVTDAANPVEVLRVIHSFDPCIACGVHLIEKESGAKTYIKVI